MQLITYNLYIRENVQKMNCSRCSDLERHVDHYKNGWGHEIAFHDDACRRIDELQRTIDRLREENERFRAQLETRRRVERIELPDIGRPFVPTPRRIFYKKLDPFNINKVIDRTSPFMIEGRLVNADDLSMNRVFEGPRYPMYKWCRLAQSGVCTDGINCRHAHQKGPVVETRSFEEKA